MIRPCAKYAQLPEESIVVIVSYSEDINGLPFTTPEATNLITKISKVPVFILGSDSFPKDGGAIGGYVINYINVGREFGKAANQIIRGTDPKSIKVDLPSFYQYIFDWRELKKWDLLDSKAIPDQSTILNQHHSFFSEYKWYILRGNGIYSFSNTGYYLFSQGIQNSKKGQATNTGKSGYAIIK